MGSCRSRAAPGGICSPDTGQLHPLNFEGRSGSAPVSPSRLLSLSLVCYWRRQRSSSTGGPVRATVVAELAPTRPGPEPARGRRSPAPGGVPYGGARPRWSPGGGRQISRRLRKKIRQGKKKEGPLVIDGVHNNGVVLSSIPDFQFLHPNKSWNELIPNPETRTKLGRGWSHPQNAGRLRSTLMTLQPNTRQVFLSNGHQAEVPCSEQLIKQINGNLSLSCSFTPAIRCC
jgi:hypothetical protein